MAVKLPKVPQAVPIGFKAVAMPLKLMSKLNIGPFGGENVVSNVIEALIADAKGKTIDFEMSKTDQFLFEKMRTVDVDELVEYRELNHEVQREILARFGERKLGVIWIGAGVFTTSHPLIAERKPSDWHIWTDAHPIVMRSVQEIFDKLRAEGDSYGLSYDVMLPQDVGKLNRIIKFLVQQGVEQIVFLSYGLLYALTMQENYAWMSQINLPEGIDISIVFNAPSREIDSRGKLLAAVNNQRFVCFEDEHIKALFDAALPSSEVIWSKARSATRHNIWSTWLIHLSAEGRNPRG